MTQLTERVAWGAAPLSEQLEFAEATRAVAALVLSLEGECPELTSVVGRLREAERRLALRAPADMRPRVGPHLDGDGRVFLDHGGDIGSYNPMFPVYTLQVDGPERATGTVNFPICYEGPAGCVNGGFLAVFFDQVVQHHNCVIGVSGATRDLNVTYRRPTPLLVDLDFEITRELEERSVVSRARITRDGETLCAVHTRAAVWDPALSPPVSPRRGSA